MNIVSFSPFGYEGFLVTVEVDLRRGIPAVDLVGLADNAVKEARERMRAAIRNSGFEFPNERVLISLSPADVKKEGAGFDLAIALAVLLEQKNIKDDKEKFSLKKILVMGELELSGKVRGVRGVNAAVSSAAELGVKHCIVPITNKEEAQVLGLMNVHGVESLNEASEIMVNIVECLEKEDSKKSEDINEKTNKDIEVEFSKSTKENDMGEVLGQSQLVRALQIAASGFHNLIAYGSPGCGKSLALQRFPSIMPNLTKEEAIPVTRIYSLAGLMKAGEPLIKTAPFRIPHQSASLQGIIGGGKHCLPGEISLAHNGALFLDEAAEFRTSVLQALRVPLENGNVTLSRAGRHTVYPANFQLLIATNPCPCGNFGAPDKICVCNSRAVEQYWKKFSSPLLDRIDIRVPVFSSKNRKPYKTSEELRHDIARAISIQRSRQGKQNALLLPEEINYYCKLDQGCKDFMNEQVIKNGFSARAIHSCIKLARTIADMAGSVAIRQEDLAEAVELRKNEGGIDIMF
ncbi:MAG: YifB family Mg chelatase-like AAA ATPase [Treponema sp.]|nr:YifB family Mg chelatase-like AAA ATPase [Treponema sp.]